MRLFKKGSRPAWYAGYECGLGLVSVALSESGITDISISPSGNAEPFFEKMAERWGLSLKRDAPRFAKIFKALDGYFKGGGFSFGLPLSPTGTEFEIRVWKALARIPWGEVRSYGQVASHIGSPKAARAVGNACGQNPIPIIIPCHRVLKGDGGIGGYTGGIGIKKFLLELEGIRL